MRNINFIKSSYLMILFFLFASATSWGQTDVLDCPLGTIQNNTMTFNTDNFTISHQKGTDNNFSPYSPWRVYTNNTVTFTGNSDVKKITSIVITAETNAYATAAINGTLTIVTGTGTISGTSNNTTATINVTGDNVKSIRLKPSAQTRWSKIVINYETNITGPNITTTGTVSGLSYAEGSGPSNVGNFTASGSLLDGSTVTVTAPTNFEVSTDGVTFGDSQEIEYTEDEFTNQTISVRLKAGLTIGNYSGNVTIDGGGISAPKTVAVSGAVVAPPPANDLCENATELTVNGGIVNGTMLNATLSTPFDKKDVWYKFTATHSGTYVITVSGFKVAPNNTNADVDIEMFSNLCPSSTTYLYNSAGSSNIETISKDLTQGTTYYLRVLAYNTSAENSTFSVELTGPSPKFTANPTSLTGFDNVIGYPSDAKNFNLTGVVLDGSDVTLTTGNGYEISSAIDGTFGETLTISGQTSINQTVYVRLNGSTENTNATGTVVVAGGNAPSITVNLSGAIRPVPNAPTMTEEDYTATVGVAFNQAIVYDGEPTSFAVTSGVLPAGISLNGTTGVFSGTPTQAGNFNVTVTSTDAYAGSETADFTFEIAKGTQSATFSDLSLGLGGDNVNLATATAQGIALTYTSSNSNVVSINGNVLSIVGVGTAIVTASNGGDTNYENFSTTFEVSVVNEVLTKTVGFESNEGFVASSSYNNTTPNTHGSSGSQWSVYYGTPSTNNAINGSQSLQMRHYSSAANNKGYAITLFSIENLSKVVFNAKANGRITVSYSNDGGNTFVGGQEFILTNASSAVELTYSLPSIAENGRIKFEISGNAPNSGNTPYIIDDVKFYVSNPAPSEIIWDGAAWSNEVGPNENDDVIIDGALSLDGDLEVKNITVSESGAIVVNAGVTLTVNGAISNLGTADQFTVESDGNLLQTSTDTNLGDIVVKRVSEPMVRLNYAMWSSPVAGQNILAFSPETVVTRFYTYEGTATFVTVNDVANKTFDVARGYLIRTPNTWWENDAPVAPQTYLGQFVGTPNNGTQTLAIHADSYTSVGNPYPSNININEFFEANTGIGAIYLWKNNAPTETYGDAGGQYLTINELGDTSGNNIQNISVGQGFIVSSENGTDEVVFTNEMRTNVSAGFHSKGTNGVEAHRMWVSLNDENSTKLNQILVGYASNATNDIDANYDSKLLNPSGSYIYSNINEEAYAIQGRALPFDAQDVVALGVNIAEAGRYTISLNSFDGLFADGDTTIYLKDKSLDVVHNLMESAYTFEAVSGVDNTRFEIIYTTEGEMGVSDLTKQAITIYAVGNDVNILSKDSSIKSVQIFDMQGRNIHNASKVNANQLTISTIAKGVLVVKVETANGKIYNQKVIVK